MKRRTATVTTAVILALFATSPLHAAPKAPAPVASQAPLREIGRVHAKTRFCQDVTDTGAAVTSSALAGDAALEDDFRYLGSVDLDSTVLSKQRGLMELNARYTSLGERARAAVEQSKALRALADSAPTPEQKAALTDYANALGGALHRQIVLAQALSRFMLYVQTQEPVSEQDRDLATIDASWRPLAFGEHSYDPRDRVPPTLSEVAHAAGAELAARRTPELEDETRAAKSADAAFMPCIEEAPTLK